MNSASFPPISSQYSIASFADVLRFDKTKSESSLKKVLLIKPKKIVDPIINEHSYFEQCSGRDDFGVFHFLFAVHEISETVMNLI